MKKVWDGALVKLVRGKLKAALSRRRPDLVVLKAAWGKPSLGRALHRLGRPVMVVAAEILIFSKADLY